MPEFILCEKCRKSGFVRPSACCPTQPKVKSPYRDLKSPYRDQEVLFFDKAIGEAMLKNWGGEPWIFWKHPDGQWVSYRKATERDISLICKLCL